PTLSNTLAAFRKSGGCSDSDNNSADFAAAAPAPRNSSSPLNLCAAPSAPSGAGSASPASLSAGDSTVLMVTVAQGSNPASTGISVIGNLSAIGGSAAQSFFDDGSNGDAVAGDGVFSYQATVGASTVSGPVGIPFTVSDAQSRSSFGNIGLTVTRAPDALNIHDIQGPGVKSPVEGDFVETSGIVTALKSNGFFIQNSDMEADGDANTSEGLFVFTSSRPPATAAIGNR